MSGGTLNLSLLSRGVGEVHTNGHEKVDVYLEPQDYLNFLTQDDPFYSRPGHGKLPPPPASSQEVCSEKEVYKLRVPKTYSTRRGALLLFSEDLAHKYTDLNQQGAHNSLSDQRTQISLKTVEDLANSILKYGHQGHLNDRICLKFVHTHRGALERQFRPGFSAKRYLSTWTRTWDDAVFDSVIRHGYIAERSLYQYSLSLPGLRRRLVYDDLSRVPEPYKLMRNMLMSPGSLSGYSFYMARSLDVENQNGEKLGSEDLELSTHDKLQNIRVIKTKDNIQKEIVYADLNHQSQREVITDLLVKSAVSYALKTQEEVYKDAALRALKRKQSGSWEEEEGSDSESLKSAIRKFDMKEAVESLLDSQHGRLPLGAALADVGGHSQGLAGVDGARHEVSNLKDLGNKHWTNDDSGSEPGTDRRGSTESLASLSNVPVLPPIQSNLPPTKNVSLEVSQSSVTLPPLVNGESHVQYMKGSRIMAPDGEIISVGGAIGRGGWQNLDGGAIGQGGWQNLDGGAMGDGPRHVEDTGFAIVKASINGVKASENLEEKRRAKILPKIKRNKKACSTDVQPSWVVSDIQPSMVEVPEQAVVDMLTSHARLVAENVLSHPSAGANLETDIKLAADLWSQMHTSKPLSQATNFKDTSADVIAEVMRSRPASSESSSAEEYQSLIRKSLSEAVATDAGLEQNLPTDAVSSPDWLHALVTQQVTSPDQIQAATGSDGRARIQAKVTGSGNGRELPMEHPDSPGSEQNTETRHLEDHELPTALAGVDQNDFRQRVTRESVISESANLPTKEKIQSSKEHKVISQVVKKGKTMIPHASMNEGKEKKADTNKHALGTRAGTFPQGQTSTNVKDKGKSIDTKEEPFIAGMPKEKPPNYKPREPSHSNKDVKKVKKGKKVLKGIKGEKKAVKQNLHQQPATVRKLSVEKPAVDKTQELPDVERQVSPPQLLMETNDAEPRVSSPEVKSGDSESEYSFVREQSSPEIDQSQEQQDQGLSQSRHQVSSPDLEEDDDRLNVGHAEADETRKLKSISNQEARAAKRAAAAARRREEVEHRRKLKEEQLKREKEDMERQMVLQKEMDEQRKKGEEERRLRKHQQLEEEEQERMEAEEAERKRKLEAERERRAKEEYHKKLEEMRRRQQEEEIRRRELMLLQQKEEEERRAAEEVMLSKMALEERLEYERMKLQKEEERRRKELEEKMQRAEEAKAAVEEAQRLAAEMARKQAELEARLRFNRSIQEETWRLTQAHSINRAFVFSYFELLQWLGLDIPEFELAKLAEY